MIKKGCLLLILLFSNLAYSIHSKADVSVDEFIGREYKILRAELVSSGWIVNLDGVGEPVFPGYPEIDCGGGRDAICSAGFKKGNEYIAVTVSMSDKKLLVKGSY